MGVSQEKEDSRLLVSWKEVCDCGTPWTFVLPFYVNLSVSVPEFIHILCTIVQMSKGYYQHSTDDIISPSA